MSNLRALMFYFAAMAIVATATALLFGCDMPGRTKPTLIKFSPSTARRGYADYVLFVAADQKALGHE